MTIRTWAREFRDRWPAIRSILRDGTVVYRATIYDGELHIRRLNSTLMHTQITGSDQSVVSGTRKGSTDGTA